MLVGLTILLLAIGCLNLSSMLVTTVARDTVSSRSIWRSARDRGGWRGSSCSRICCFARGGLAAIPIVWWAARMLAAQIWTGLVPMTLT